MKSFWSRVWQSAAVVVAALAGLASIHAQAATPAEIRVDYAYYSPESLVIRHFGWLDDEFKADHTAIRWVLSLGSNRALEYLNSGAVDFGSAAGLASVLARANGNPIHTVYVFSRPEWTAPLPRNFMTHAD
jgi:sulfonate transport system substrate-binding protein